MATSAKLDLLEAWAAWQPNGPPFLFDDDRDRLASPRSSRACVCFNSWHAAFTDPSFGQLNDRRLHVGLLPHPYCGDLRRASIYLLMLNPGLGPWDYYGEYEVPDYGASLIANLKQDFTASSYPFLFLDPQFSWHGGFTWWYGKFARIIKVLADHWNISIADARLALGTRIASIELVPYHSPQFQERDGWLQRRQLPSIALAREFVAQTVLPRVRSGSAIAIVTRQVQSWTVSDMDGIMQYTAQQARAAHLSPTSPGGRAILRHLLKT